LSGSVSREALHDIWLAEKKKDSQLNLDDPLKCLPDSANGIDM
jgi:hypothetical protein